MATKGNHQVEKDIDLLTEFQRMGIPVFACTLRMAKSPEGKDEEVGHPKRWQETTPDQYDLWSASRSGAFGVVTGHGLDVLDVDPRNGGDVDAVLQALQEHQVPVIGIVDTPGGGIHVYLPSIQTALPGRMPEGIDFLAKGQMAFAPPSVRPKYPGKRYKWRTRPNLLGIRSSPEQVMAFLISLSGPGLSSAADQGPLPKGIGKIATVEDAVEYVLASTPGERNTVVFTVAARLAGLNALDHQNALRLIDAAVAVGLSQAEVVASLESGGKLGTQRRDAAARWSAGLFANSTLPRTRAVSMKNAVTYLQDMFSSHGDSVGLSCRELAEGINCSHQTASKNLRALVSAGHLLREPSIVNKDHSAVYSMPGVDLDGTRKLEKVDSQRVTTSTSTPPPVGCKPFAIPKDRLLVVSRHHVFTRGRSRSPLPPKSAETLVALETGACTAKQVADLTTVSIDTVRGHFRILESAGLISTSRRSMIQVEQRWDGDLLAALDNWGEAMQIEDVSLQRRVKHQAQREYYRNPRTRASRVTQPGRRQRDVGPRIYRAKNL